MSLSLSLSLSVSLCVIILENVFSFPNNQTTKNLCAP